MTPTATGSPVRDVDDANPSQSYLRVVIVEILVLAGLYWAGRYFG
jgi:hypothetical protein